MTVIGEAKAKIKDRGLKLVMPEGEDERIRAAADQLKAAGLAEPIVFAAHVPEAGRREAALITARRGKMTEALALRLLKKPLYRAAAMVAVGDAVA